MARPVKCKVCGKPFDLDVEGGVSIPRSRRYIHINCFKEEDFVNTEFSVIEPKPKKEKKEKKEPAPKAEPKPKAKKVEKVDERQPILDYCKEIFGATANYAAIQKQIKEYITKYGYTYSGILKTLQYWYEVKKNDNSKANGSIAIVPYVYNQALEYYYALYLADMANKEASITKVIKEINIEAPRPKTKPIDLFLGE